MVGVRWRSCSRFHREKNVTAARPSEQFEPLGSMIRSLEFQAGGFYVSFLWSFIALVQSVSNFLLSPDVVGNKGFWQIICHDVIMPNGENSQGWSPF